LIFGFLGDEPAADLIAVHAGEIDTEGSSGVGKSKSLPPEPDTRSITTLKWRSFRPAWVAYFRA